MQTIDGHHSIADEAETIPDYFTNDRPEMAERLPARLGRVLEIGCGGGAFASHLTSADELWGIEPSPDAAAHATARGAHVVRVGTFEQVRSELPSDGFDTVVCNDVIEHMTDHDGFLRDIQAVMTPAATLVGSVPNVRHLRNLAGLLVAKDWRYTDEGTLDRTHQRYFTLKSLGRSLEAAGFEIDLLEGINGPSRRSAPSHWLAALGFDIVTLGTQRDARFLQLAFRARLP